MRVGLPSWGFIVHWEKYPCSRVRTFEWILCFLSFNSCEKTIYNHHISNNNFRNWGSLSSFSINSSLHWCIYINLNKISTCRGINPRPDRLSSCFHPILDKRVWHLSGVMKGTISNLQTLLRESAFSAPGDLCFQLWIIKKHPKDNKYGLACESGQVNAASSCQARLMSKQSWLTPQTNVGLIFVVRNIVVDSSYNTWPREDPNPRWHLYSGSVIISTLFFCTAEFSLLEDESQLSSAVTHGALARP